MISSNNQNGVQEIVFYKLSHTIIIKANSGTPTEVNCLDRCYLASWFRSWSCCIWIGQCKDNWTEKFHRNG